MTTQAKTELERLASAKEAAADEYESAARAARTEADEAARLAKAEVAARHAAKLARLADAKFAARQAWQAELDATASHEWEGKKVTRQKNVGRGYSPQYKTVYGVVEVRRSTTQFPANLASYSLPSMGAPFVRLLDKSGKPSKMIDSRGRFADWKLAAQAGEAGTAETVKQGSVHEHAVGGNADAPKGESLG